MSKGLPKRENDYSAWYNELVKKADLAENSAVRGCMVIKPYGYSIWEKMQAALDKMFETGVLNNGKKLNYAFGLVMREYRGIKTVRHSGGWAGFRTHIVLFPEQKFSAAVLSNLSTMKPVPLANQIME